MHYMHWSHSPKLQAKKAQILWGLFSAYIKVKGRTSLTATLLIWARMCLFRPFNYAMGDALITMDSFSSLPAHRLRLQNIKGKCQDQGVLQVTHSVPLWRWQQLCLCPIQPTSLQARWAQLPAIQIHQLRIKRLKHCRNLSDACLRDKLPQRRA